MNWLSKVLELAKFSVTSVSSIFLLIMFDGWGFVAPWTLYAIGMVYGRRRIWAFFANPLVRPEQVLAPLDPQLIKTLPKSGVLFPAIQLLKRFQQVCGHNCASCVYIEPVGDIFVCGFNLKLQKLALEGLLGSPMEEFYKALLYLAGVIPPLHGDIKRLRVEQGLPANLLKAILIVVLSILGFIFQMWLGPLLPWSV